MKLLTIQLRPRPQSGSTAVIALMIVAMGTLGLLGMVAIIQARTQQVEASEDAFLRRVRENNGRQMSREYAYRYILPSASGAGGTFTLTGGWGKIAAGSWAASPFTTSTTGEINPMGPGGTRDPFQVSVTASLYSQYSGGAWDADETPQSQQIQVRADCPALGGTLLGIHRSASGLLANNQVSGAITVNGSSYFWGADSLLVNREYDFSPLRVNAKNAAFGGADYQVTTSGVDPSVSKMMPDNLPFTAWLNHGVAGAVVNTGLLNLVAGPSGNSLTSYVTNNTPTTVTGTTAINSNGVVCNGLGTTTLTLMNANLPNLFITGTHLTLNLQGQTTAGNELAASTLNPVVIVVTSGTLLNINLLDNNTRPIILGIKRTFGLTGVGLNCTGVTNFRLMLFAEETPLTVDCNGTNVMMKGGIFTDRDLVQNNDGTLTLIQEDSPNTLENYAPRWAWVESYKQ